MASRTEYPRVRLADLRPFAQEARQPFFFDDVQAACDLTLAEGRLAVNMLRAGGVLDRLPGRPQAKPAYLLTNEGVALVRAEAEPRLTAESGAVSARGLQDWMRACNAVGLPLKVAGVSMLVPVFADAAGAPKAETLIVVQTRTAVAGELLRVQGELAQLLGVEVSLALEWWV